MAGLQDFLFGKGALNKAAGGATIPMKQMPKANLPIAADAEKMAAAKLAASKSAQPKQSIQPKKK